MFYSKLLSYRYVGVLLALLEKEKMIKSVYSSEGREIIGIGTVAAGYQNFIICIEMFFAAIGLSIAFPHRVFKKEPTASANGAKSVSLQSISSNLKETMNPRDVMVDAIHNFHPNYQEYMQQGSTVLSSDDVEINRQQDTRHVMLKRDKENYQHQMLEAPGVQLQQPTNSQSSIPAASSSSASAADFAVEFHPAIMPGLKVRRFTEKTNLLNPQSE